MAKETTEIPTVINMVISDWFGSLVEVFALLWGVFICIQTWNMIFTQKYLFKQISHPWYPDFKFPYFDIMGMMRTP